MMKKNVHEAIALISRKTLKANVDSACMTMFYQPKMPKNVERILERK